MKIARSRVGHPIGTLGPGRTAPLDRPRACSRKILSEISKKCGAFLGQVRTRCRGGAMRRIRRGPGRSTGGVSNRLFDSVKSSVGPRKFRPLARIVDMGGLATRVSERGITPRAVCRVCCQRLVELRNCGGHVRSWAVASGDPAMKQANDSRSASRSFRPTMHSGRGNRQGPARKGGSRISKERP